jgi:hypothetical protein
LRELLIGIVARYAICQIQDGVGQIQACEAMVHQHTAEIATLGAHPLGDYLNNKAQYRRVFRGGNAPGCLYMLGF